MRRDAPILLVTTALHCTALHEKTKAQVPKTTYQSADWVAPRPHPAWSTWCTLAHNSNNNKHRYTALHCTALHCTTLLPRQQSVNRFSVNTCCGTLLPCPEQQLRQPPSADYDDDSSFTHTDAINQSMKEAINEPLVVTVSFLPTNDRAPYSERRAAVVW